MVGNELQEQTEPPTLAPAAVSLIDAVLIESMCAAQDKVKADPDSHTTKCAIQCQKGGYGILKPSGFVKFDSAGNEKAAALLKSTKKTDHLRVTVEGEKKGGEIEVRSIEMNQAGGGLRRPPAGGPWHV